MFYRRRLKERFPDAMITEAESGRQGLRLYHESSPDAVLLDYNLPDLDGLEFLESLDESNSDRALLPIVMLTGHGNEEIAVEAMKLGALDYLIKTVMTGEALERAITNVVERVKLTRELDRRQKLLEQQTEEIRMFYQLVSHELKNPLTSIREFIAILIDEIPGPVNPDQTEMLEVARESCDDMKTYIDDLLDVARLETGKLEIETEAADMASLIRQVVLCHESRAKSQAIQLRTTVDPEAATLGWVDQSRIRQVLNNLLGNALKFTEAGGCITVHLASSSPDQESSSILVSVQDSGRGIPPEHLSRIFDRLYQTQRKDSGTGQGLGLGLNISREIVELHGGSIEVDSELGVGTTFTFSLPVAVAVEASPQT